MLIIIIIIAFPRSLVIKVWAAPGDICVGRKNNDDGFDDRIKQLKSLG